MKINYFKVLKLKYVGCRQWFPYPISEKENGLPPIFERRKMCFPIKWIACGTCKMYFLVHVFVVIRMAIRMFFFLYCSVDWVGWNYAKNCFPLHYICFFSVTIFSHKPEEKIFRRNWSERKKSSIKPLTR